MTAPRTLNELFFSAMDRWRDRPVVMRVKRGDDWQPLSYAGLLEQVRHLSLGLGTLGVRQGDRIAILSENRPEWAIADYACLAARCPDVPVYPTLPASQVQYLLRDSGAVAIFVSSAAQRAKIDEIRSELPALRHVIAMDADAAGGGALPFTGVQQAGRAVTGQDEAWRTLALAAEPDDLATLIYTSGTTGEPKGVMLTHGNITSNVVGGLERLPLRATDECLSFLPLSHIFERMAGHFCMMQSGAVINYATSMDTVAAEMGEIHPTVVLSHPRLYEKVYARVLENALGGSAVKKQLFFWAKRIGEQWVEYTLGQRRVPGWLALRYRIASSLVFAKLRARVGGRIRFFVSGGAPLSADIAKFFYAAGLPVLEGYGLTETSPVIAVNGTDTLKLGTVGKPLDNVEVDIAPDGEILTRGPHVMKGYFNKPDATAEAIDKRGWLHTGDIGMLDAQGFLRITDRKKDIIVTAGGKNIAPQPIENQAKTSKFVSNAVMLGDRRKFPIMLIVPNRGQLEAWAQRKGVQADRWETLLERPEVQARMEREINRVLGDRAHFELPKKLLLLPEDFSIESGDLTPTLKVRRRVVEKRFAEAIDALYAEAEKS
ncbi:MAG TPA: long-chain fatty acid--CoA ligase [Gemmatimonadales bacterium]|nr:long-chain fatty acid--CoA ligase [Gemmatimonadales bacterium]